MFGTLGFAPGNKSAANDNAPFREGDFLTDLHYAVPASPFHGLTDEHRANVAFAEIFLVHVVGCLKARSASLAHYYNVPVHMCPLAPPVPPSASDAVASAPNPPAPILTAGIGLGAVAVSGKIYAFGCFL
jgi:hypothetical protein